MFNTLKNYIAYIFLKFVSHLKIICKLNVILYDVFDMFCIGTMFKNVTILTLQIPQNI